MRKCIQYVNIKDKYASPLYGGVYAAWRLELLNKMAAILRDIHGLYVCGVNIMIGKNYLKV